MLQVPKMLFLLLSCSPEGKDSFHSGLHSGVTHSDDSSPGHSDDSGLPSTGRRYDCGGMDPADPAPLQKKIALTFDDGPSIRATPQVLEILRLHQVPATFFLVGSMASDPAVEELLLEMSADPLVNFGNHSWSHPQMDGLRLSDAEEEIASTLDFLAELGIEPGYFRFPFGVATCELVDMVREDYGMRVTGWNIDTADWCYAFGEGTCSTSDYWRVPEAYRNDMIANTVDQIVESDGGIVLFHDVHQYTADQLDSVILELKEAGFSFTSLDDIEAFPRLNSGDPYDFPWIGESCSVENDSCWQIENFSWCEAGGAPGADPDRGICVLPCGEAPCFDRDGGAPVACLEIGGGQNCLGRSDPLNAACAALPGTVEYRVEGARVCAPYDWAE